MFCEKCGTKNEAGAKFCQKCGHKMIQEQEEVKAKKTTKSEPKKVSPATEEVQEKKNEEVKKEVKEVKKETKVTEEKKVQEQEVKPKKKMATGLKVLIFIILIALIAGGIALYIILNNPVKKMTGYLENYYSDYSSDPDDNEKTLKGIKKVLKSNRKKDDVIDEIKENAEDTFYEWVNDFNTKYDSEKKLDKAYEKVTSALSSLYAYDDSIGEYLLEEDLYFELSHKLADLKESKGNFLNAQSASDKSSAYDYYGKVIEDDVYYEEAQKAMSDYLESSLEDYLNEVKEKVDLTGSEEDVLKDYIDQINYLNNNTMVGGIDVSSTQEYKDLFKEAEDKILELTKKGIETREKENNYDGALDYVKSTINSLNSSLDIYDDVKKLIVDIAKDAVTYMTNNLEYDDAEDFAKKARQSFSSSTSEYDELSKLIDSVKSGTPDDLTDQYKVESKWASSDYYRDDGDYKDAVSFRFEGETAYITYRLNNKYTRLKTKLVVGENWPSDFSGVLVISANGNELYRSDTITKTSTFDGNIDIDVTSVDDITFQFITTNDEGYDYFYLYLVEPYLYK